ncbi:hypothetical protein [Sphingosinicella sp. CPCC 101087]|uniref:hypothetical protein n=1 Tax=Sphingosinicella sp. CPCC 101087 TaxID=2497754 RepID=UPI00101DEA5D|nr:hypothetical protein [Sphingosinicella sp. CPCC 101087]
MKNILRGTVAAIALVSMASAAHAQTDERHYAATVPIFGNVTLTNPSGFGGALAAGAFEAAIAFGVGTRYTAEADAPSDSVPATPVVNVAFNLSGSVNKDCSFYSGNNAAARNIDFGVIGVRTGNNENVSDAFEMVGPAEAEIESLTAGCNFNNTVTLAKANGNAGMVNAAPGGYDSDEFQANIPYRVEASWTGIAANTVGSGTSQSLNVATNAANAAITQGAWRSDFELEIEAPVAQRALVAGDYSDTLTLTLAAS